MLQQIFLVVFQRSLSSPSLEQQSVLEAWAGPGSPVWLCAATRAWDAIPNAPALDAVLGQVLWDDPA